MATTAAIPSAAATGAGMSTACIEQRATGGATVRDHIFIHPRAMCECADVGDGTRIWAFAHVMDGAAIGRHCNIGEHVFVENGVRIGSRVTVKNQVCIWNGVTIEDDAFIGPAVIFTNDRRPRSPRMPSVQQRYAHVENWLEPTRIQQGASLGAASIILCGNTVGPYAMVGAGSLVTRDVPAFAMVLGSPARVVGWVCRCGRRLGEALHCDACNQSFRRVGDGREPGSLEMCED